MSAMTPKKADTTVPETPRRRAGGPRESAARTRLSIIEASIQEFSQKGFEGARVDEIALRAGVNKNLLYHHFGNKDGLFVAVLTHTYENIRSRQQDIQLRTVDPEAGMRRLVISTGKIWVQFPEFQRLLMSENLAGGRHVASDAAFSDLYNPLLDTIEQLLARGREAGVFRDDIDPIDLYISVTSLTAHYVNNQHTFEAIFRQKLMTPQRVRQRLEHAADMVIRYLKKD